MAWILIKLTGTEDKRFGQTHIVIYSVGIFIFLCVFLFEKLTSFFSASMGKIFCCCLNRTVEGPVFSNNLYKEIPSEAQRKEYLETKSMIKKIKSTISKEEHSEWSALRAYYIERLTLKVKSIKYELECALSFSKID